MKRDAALLGDAIGRYLNELKVPVSKEQSHRETHHSAHRNAKGAPTKKTSAEKAARKSMDLLVCWQQVAPLWLYEHTDNVVYSTRSQGTEILVFMDNAAYAAEMTMDKELYRIRMQQETKKEIDDIKFLVSRRAGRFLRNRPLTGAETDNDSEGSDS